MPRKFKKLLFKMINEALEHNSEFNLSELCLLEFPNKDTKGMTIYNGSQIMEDFIDDDIESKVGAITGGQSRWRAMLAFFKEEMTYGAYIARIALGTPESGGHEGSCMNAWEVVSSGVHPRYQKKGLGRMLYSIAMVSVSPDPIMSDRGSVSPKAQRMYKAMDSSPSVESLPSEEGPYKGEFDNFRYPKTPPKDDDCSLYVDDDGNLGPSYMNKAYKIEPSGEYKQLYDKMVQNHKKFVEEISQKVRVMPEKLEDLIDGQGSKVFSIAYGHQT